MEIRRWLLRLLALLTTTTALLLSPSTSTSSSISTIHDLPALLSFKSLITKDPLGALSSWTINSSSNASTHGFCSWTGVKCSSAHPGHVKALRLQGLSLSGTISPFLGNLSRLRALDLSDNKLEEYGMGTEISVECDVYSYGVLLLEMLTGRRPTDPFLGDTTNLPKYVEMDCPGNLLEIMDVNIRCNQEPQATLELFAAPVSRLGLACCRGSARQRINMGDMVKELGAIKRIIMASQNYSSWSTAQ